MQERGICKKHTEVLPLTSQPQVRWCELILELQAKEALRFLTSLKDKQRKKPRKSFAILLWGKCTDFLPGPVGIKQKSVCQHFIGHGIPILLHGVNLRPTNVQINHSGCEQLLKPRILCRWLSPTSYGNKSGPGDEQVKFWLHWYATETISFWFNCFFFREKKNQNPSQCKPAPYNPFSHLYSSDLKHLKNSERFFIFRHCVLWCNTHLKAATANLSLFVPIHQVVCI